MNICLIGCRLPPLDGYVSVCPVLTIDIYITMIINNSFSLHQLTVLNAGRKYLGLDSLAGKVFLTSGLGGMSGAQAKVSKAYLNLRHLIK